MVTEGGTADTGERRRRNGELSLIGRIVNVVTGTPGKGVVCGSTVVLMEAWRGLERQVNSILF